MTKVPTQWKDENGYDLASPDNEGVQRVTEDGSTRITEASDTRVLEATVITSKPPTVWTDA